MSGRGDDPPSARVMLASAQAAEQLHQVQAVILLPLHPGLSLKQTARVSGHHQNMTPEQERAMLAFFLNHARGAILGALIKSRASSKAALVRPIALSSLDDLLHRHDWRKLFL